LKFEGAKLALEQAGVAPHAGAWIEIIGHLIARSGSFVAPHAGAWIEIFYAGV